MGLAPTIYALHCASLLDPCALADKATSCELLEDVPREFTEKHCTPDRLPDRFYVAFMCFLVCCLQYIGYVHWRYHSGQPVFKPVWLSVIMKR